MVAVVLRDEDINFTLNSHQDHRGNENEIKMEERREEEGAAKEKKGKEIQYNPGQLGAFLRIDMKMWLV